MITLQEFVEEVASYEAGRKHGGRYFYDSCETEGRTGRDAVSWWFESSLADAVGDYGDDEVLDFFDKSPFAAVVHPDGSAQLLSRDEDECLLFTTLWELER